MNDMRKIKLAQIGTGHPHAAGIMMTVRDMPHLFDTVAVAEPEEEFCGNLSGTVYGGLKKCGLDEILNDESIEAVTIETTENNSCKYAVAALERGKAVFMDKPGGESREAFAKAVRSAEAKGLPFSMGYMYRTNPAVKRCLELARSGALGDIFLTEGSMSINIGADAVKKYAGGMQYFLGCHILDIAYAVMGEPEEVAPMCFSSSSEKGGALDCGLTVLSYKGGKAVIRAGADEINGFSNRHIRICGTTGTAEILPIEEFCPDDTLYLKTSLKLTLASDNPQNCFDCGEVITFPKYKRYDGMMEAFAKAVTDGFDKRLYNYEINLHDIVLSSCGL